MFVKKIFNHHLFIVFIIFCLALSIRLFGLNWDQNQHLHPDERFLTMIISTIEFPNSIVQYFDTKSSPLNPFNYQQFNFFVYGTFPLFLVKTLGHLFNIEGYDKIHLLGRTLSAVFDSLNIFSLYFLAKLFISKNKKFFLFSPSLLYAFTVLPIQLSHFFTVDTFLTFFILLSFVCFSYWLKTNKNIFLIFASITFGLSLSCKISAFLFSPVILLFFIYQIFKKKTLIFLKIFISLFISFIVFRIFQPYSFISLIKINPDFIKSLVYLKSILINKDVFYPPEIQWLSKTPILYPLKNIILWGLGLPLSFVFLLFFIKYIYQKITSPFLREKVVPHLRDNKRVFKKIFLNSKNFTIFLCIFWTIFLFIQQGNQFTATMRYFLVIYPFITIIVTLIFQNNLSKKILYLILFFHFSYAIIFISIYTRPHSRVQASNWIYKNIPSSSTIANEYWDDALPLSFNPYQNQNLHLYDPDTSEKWQKINSTLKKTDYIFLTSNRLWSSIPLVPNRYPIATKYYQDLFDGKSDFKKEIEFNSYPGLSLPFLKNCIYIGPTNFPYSQTKNKWFEVDNTCLYPGVYLRDDIAEEAFSVYDHPKVIIFKKFK